MERESSTKLDTTEKNHNDSVQNSKNIAKTLMNAHLVLNKISLENCETVQGF